MADVKLQVLLHNPATADAAAEVLSDLGAAITGRGQVTLSATMSQPQFEQVFGRAPRAEGGFTEAPEGALPVPDRLKSSVESISQAPRHISMD